MSKRKNYANSESPLDRLAGGNPVESYTSKSNRKLDIGGSRHSIDRRRGTRSENLERQGLDSANNDSQSRLGNLSVAFGSLTTDGGQMKISIPLVAVPLLMLSAHHASAPVPVPLAVALKCVAIGVIIPTAVILYKCDQNFYLVGYKPGEGEDPWWECSKANPNTLKKLNGRRWQGPWKTPDEPTARAWANSLNPANPPFGMSALGTIPNPNTNALRIALETCSGGGRWSQVATTTADPNDNLSFVVFLTNAGTNGMNAYQLRQVADCDVAVTNTTTSSSALFRLSGRELLPVGRHLETAPTP